jgi:hypothetical protein
MDEPPGRRGCGRAIGALSLRGAYAVKTQRGASFGREPFPPTRRRSPRRSPARALLAELDAQRDVVARAAGADAARARPSSSPEI